MPDTVRRASSLIRECIAGDAASMTVFKSNSRVAVLTGVMSFVRSRSVSIAFASCAVVALLS